MKVSHAVDNVRSSEGLGDTAEYKIADNAHMFKILSSGLYSDKVRAVLREIGCNARDAHIMAGKGGQSIRVKLPNSLSDQFYIQDWGPGLSHKDVMGLYSTYGASTKQTSNDFTGAFGLGSKSPFAYTDSFSVVSTHEGKKRTYTCYLSNVGTPTTSLMTEEEPEPGWESGMRVGFAVKGSDYPTFHSKAQEVFQWFDPLPELKGAQLQITAPRFKERHASFWLLDSPEEPDKIQVVMGSVAYPLDEKALGVQAVSNDPKGKTDLLDFLSITSGLVLPVPVGSAMPTPSRESLQYDPATVKSIQDLCRKAVRHMGQEIVQVLDEVEKGGWKELCKAKQKVQAVLPKALGHSFARLGAALGLDKRRAEQFNAYLRQDNMELPIHQVVNSAVRFATMRHGKPMCAKLHAHDRRDHKGNTIRGAEDHRGRSWSLEVRERTVIAHGADRGGALRARFAVSEGLYDQVIAVCRDKDKTPSKAEMLSDAQALSAALDKMEVVDLSALPLPPDALVKKARRPKGWVPTMDPKEKVPCVTFKSEETLALGDLSPRVMMCRRERSSWGHSSHMVREYDKSVEDDREWDAGTWSKIWAAYTRLAQAMALPDTADTYAFPTAGQIRGLYMVEGGYTSMFAEIKKYAERSDLRPALKRKLATWRPMVPEYVGYSAGWVTQLAHLMFNSPLASTELRGPLEKVKLYDTLAAVVKSSKGKPTGARSVALKPPYLEAYEQLCGMVGVKAEALSVGEGITLEDMDKSFAERFPLAKALNAQQFVEFYKRDTVLGTQLLELLLSKEIT